jgi:hypothetical protein
MLQVSDQPGVRREAGCGALRIDSGGQAAGSPDQGLRNRGGNLVQRRDRAVDGVRPRGQLLGTRSRSACGA